MGKHAGVPFWPFLLSFGRGRPCPVGCLTMVGVWWDLKLCSHETSHNSPNSRDSNCLHRKGNMCCFPPHIKRMSRWILVVGVAGAAWKTAFWDLPTEKGIGPISLPFFEPPFQVTVSGAKNLPWHLSAKPRPAPFHLEPETGLGPCSFSNSHGA